MNKVVLLLLVFVCLSRATVFPVNDKNIYFSEHNWVLAKDGKFAQTNYPGAYLKVGFTGTSISIHLNSTSTPKTPYMTIRLSVNDGPANDFTLPQTNDVFAVKGLPNSGTHKLFLIVKNSNQNIDRWNVPTNVIAITGLEVDNGASLSAVDLLPHRTLIYWDSIGEGVGDLGFSAGGDLADNDASATWAYALATGLQSEVSMIAFGRLGWTISGNGNVAPVFTPGDDAQSSWNKIDSTHKRDFSGQIDYIFCGHGTNDNGRPAANVTNSALGWLKALRAAVGAKPKIFLTIPFGGFNQAPLKSAFQQYQSKGADASTVLIDLGAEGQRGLNGRGRSWESADGIHPLVWRGGQLGALLVAHALE